MGLVNAHNASGMLQDARRCSTGPFRRVRRTRCRRTGVCPSFQMLWWTCMPEPLSPKMGLGMKVTVLPFRRATFLITYLNRMRLSAIYDQGGEPHVDFGLPGGGHFVMLRLHLRCRNRSARHHDHLGADVLLGVGGRNRK